MKQAEEDLQRISLKERDYCDRNNFQRITYTTKFLRQKGTGRKCTNEKKQSHVEKMRNAWRKRKKARKKSMLLTWP